MPDPIIAGARDSTVAVLANCIHQQGTTAYSEILAGMARDEQRKLNAKPVLSDADARKTMVYRMGLIAGLEMGASVPGLAVDGVNRVIKRATLAA